MIYCLYFECLTTPVNKQIFSSIDENFKASIMNLSFGQTRWKYVSECIGHFELSREQPLSCRGNFRSKREAISKLSPAISSYCGAANSCQCAPVCSAYLDALACIGLLSERARRNCFVHVFLTLSMYSYCGLCILIVRPCTLIVVYVYLLLTTYS